MAEEKRQADSLTLRQTQVMCEVGQKSEADVVQMEAQLAADEYEVTRQESALSTAWLMLKQLMGTHPQEDFVLLPIGQSVDADDAVDADTADADTADADFKSASHESGISNPLQRNLLQRNLLQRNPLQRNPLQLRSGQTHYLNLELGQSEQAILIPRGAFFQTTGGQWIFVVSKDGSKAYRRTIRIGRQNPQYYEVLEGLQPGEQVITSGYESFKDYEQLNIK